MLQYSAKALVSILSALIFLLVLAPEAAVSAPRTAVCPDGATVANAGAGILLSCVYAPTNQHPPSHDGGPWLNVDLLHASQADLDALRNRTSGTLIFQPGSGEHPPEIPALGLVHAQICLSDPDVLYSDCPNDYPDNRANRNLNYTLNPKLIPALEKGLDRVRKAGLKVVLRFTYNFPSCEKQEKNGAEVVVCTPRHPQDAPMSVILTHMRQLAPTVQANADVIFSLQAGFIGRWGEWHNSTNGNDTTARRNEFLDEYRRLFQRVTNLEVRRPGYILDYQASLLRRRRDADLLSLGLGLHDDDFASNVDDGATFQPTAHYTACKLKRTAARLAAEFTMTAETSVIYDFDPPPPECRDPKLNPLNFDEFAAAYSLTTIQLRFGPDVWRQWWIDGTYRAKIRKIGPHLRLDAAELHVDPSRRAQLQLVLSNTGWAGIARPRPMYLTVRTKGGLELRQKIDVDLTAVPAGGTLRRTVKLGYWTKLPAGRYHAYLAAPDPSWRLVNNPAYALYFENEGTVREADGLNYLGSFSYP